MGNQLDFDFGKVRKATAPDGMPINYTGPLKKSLELWLI